MEYVTLVHAGDDIRLLITEEEKAFVNGLFLASIDDRKPMSYREAAYNLYFMQDDGIGIPESLTTAKYRYLWNECFIQQH